MHSDPVLRQLERQKRAALGGFFRRIHLDGPLLFLLVILLGCGLAILYSASSRDFGMVKQQMVHITLASICMVVLAQVRPEILQKYALLLYIIGVITLLGVLLIGDIGKGAQRWLIIGGFRFQPSEILKVAMPLIAAWWVTRMSLPPKVLTVVAVLVMTAVPVFLIAKQPDLGTAILVGTSGLAVLFFAGLRWRFIVISLILFSVTVPIIWNNLYDYQRDRIHTFLDPSLDPLGSGYHIIQSKIAIGSGGLNGKGWLEGTQSHLDFLPERHTDFIYAVFGEEFGLVGVFAIMVLYFLIIIRGLVIASRSATSFGHVLGCTLSFMLFVYIFVNVGMVSGLLPVVGVPLPLVSYGGTSMVTIMMTFGLLMSVATHRQQDQDLI